MRRAHTAFVISLLLMLPLSNSFATDQVSDRLRVRDEEFQIEELPLEPFLEQHPDRRPRFTLTSLQRGYFATWSISEGRLVLVDVVSASCRGANSSSELTFCSVIGDVFAQQPPVWADWYTGHIIVLAGGFPKYTQAGIDVGSSIYMVISISRGHVSETRRLTAAEFRRFQSAQLRACRKTPEYAAAVENLKLDGLSRREIDSILASDVLCLSRVFER